MSAQHQRRIARLQERLVALELDGLIVTNLVNVRYLTGYDGSNGAVCVSSGGARFLTDFRYAEATRGLAALLDVEIIDRDLIAALAERSSAIFAGAQRIGFEADQLPYACYETIAAGLPGGVELVATRAAVEALREVKSAEELAAIRAACAPVDAAYAALADDGLAGRSERDAAWWIEGFFRAQGCEASSFAPIVASGPHGALPHADPRDVLIEPNTLVVVDIGALLDGYCSDCTRTFATGPLPQALADDYALVLEAQLAGIAAVRPGATGREVDAAARAIIAAAGAGELFGHGLGHGVGLEVHEGPTLRKTSDDVLVPGNVVSIEPGVYRPGQWGVRIEDLVVVTEDGCEILTGFTKALTQAG